jgi:predicted nuclease with TOPRIM domain
MSHSDLQDLVENIHGRVAELEIAGAEMETKLAKLHGTDTEMGAIREDIRQLRKQQVELFEMVEHLHDCVHGRTPPKGTPR